MPEATIQSTTLADAGPLYLASLSPDTRRIQTPEVNRFLRWFGPSRRMAELRGVDIERFVTEQATATDAEVRLRVLRAFLAYAKKVGITTENLSVHVRLRRTSGGGSGAEMIAEERLDVTAEGLAVLQKELEALRGQRPEIAETLRAAMADKDFRENAPLDAAREQQAHVEARIRELETMLKRAHVVANDGGGRNVRLGSHVRLRDMQTDREVFYILVGPGEVNAAEGKISVASPVGRALLEHTVGDEVEVSAPSKTFRFRIETIDA